MFRQAKAMPKEQAIGPKQQGPSWSVARAMAERASEASTRDDIYLAKELMDVAWKQTQLRSSWPSPQTCRT